MKHRCVQYIWADEIYMLGGFMVPPELQRFPCLAAFALPCLMATRKLLAGWLEDAAQSDAHMQATMHCLAGGLVRSFGFLAIQ